MMDVSCRVLSCVWSVRMERRFVCVDLPNDTFGSVPIYLPQAAEAQPMPTSLDGFKRHPKFVLERHLGAYLCFVYGMRGKGMDDGRWTMEGGGGRAFRRRLTLVVSCLYA